MRERFINANFKPAKLLIIQRANEIITRYLRRGIKLTLRALYYQFIAHDLFPEDWIDDQYNRKHGLAGSTKNTMKNYKRLADIIDDGRKAGLVDWDQIVDETRELEKINVWEGPDDIIGACAKQYKIDRWATQDHHVEVWVEKDAVQTLVRGTCERNLIGLISCRGYPSSSLLWREAKRLGQLQEAGKQVLVLYLGDHDPSGIDMTRNLEESLEMFARRPIQIDRLALNYDQVEQYNPPPNPAKQTDSRCAGYVEKFGEESWELDALDPDVMNRQIQQAIDRVRDKKLWEEAGEQEEQDQQLLQKCSDNWQRDVVPMLEGLDD